MRRSRGWRPTRRAPVDAAGSRPPVNSSAACLVGRAVSRCCWTRATAGIGRSGGRHDRQRSPGRPPIPVAEVGSAAGRLPGSAPTGVRDLHGLLACRRSWWARAWYRRCRHDQRNRWPDRRRVTDRWGISLPVGDPTSGVRRLGRPPHVASQSPRHRCRRRRRSPGGASTAPGRGAPPP
jgi:hypothetical protein